MIIYDQEHADGLSEKILASSSIAYQSAAEPCSISLSNKSFKSLASYDDNDLYYVQSILVSSSWNKNDDIFDKYEVWSAKNTPEHKPTNLEHNENLIVGHIISNWPITTEGLLIDPDTPIDNLPEKFHILTGSVIYKAFSDPILRERSEKLISEIQNGNKFVSMECLFKGFDYGLINKTTNEYKILARNNQTAYLTKHLKAYGGKGENNEYKIGRVLRNITFTGKGFVDKPANEDSIIFTSSLFTEKKNKDTLEKNNEITNLGVSNIRPNDQTENYIMSVEQDVTEIKQKLVAMETSCQAAVAEAEASVSSLKEENTKLVSQLQTQSNEFTERENAMKKELEDVKTSASEELLALKASLEAQINELSEALAAKEEEMKKKEHDMKDKEEALKKMKADLDAATETVAAYKTKEEEMLKKEKMMKRKAALTESGVDDEAAVAFVEKFEAMDDEAFDAMATLFAAVKTKKEEAMKMKPKASEDTTEATISEPKVSASDLENVEVEPSVDLAVGSDSSEEEENTTRAALIEFVYSKLGKK
jgi:hypothetical protein